MLHTAELIQKKRDGLRLSDAEIQSLIAGVAKLTVSDAQIAAFAMAVWFRGMDVHEQSALTLAMRDTGTILSWTGLGGPVLDKHSTGGVGDLVSLVLGPLVAAGGAYVPMISGRGLGHTGGTLDKLESIPGFTTRLDIERFQGQVKDVGIAMIGQTSDLAPADRRLYAVRDVTATVASVPLIVSSILSKKLAEGLDGLVMDIKVGSGAFMPELEHARLLALDISRVAVESGVACNAIITDMNHPLAWSAGNAVEMKEAIAYLRGDARNDRLHTVVMELASELFLLGGLAADYEQASVKARSLLESGGAAECFARMVAAQGGPVDLLEKSAIYLADAAYIRPVPANLTGYVQELDMRAIGTAVVRLGGGRVHPDDAIDHAVGLSDVCQPGLRLSIDTPLAVIHARNEQQWERAAADLRKAIRVTEFPSGDLIAPVIWERIEGGKVN